MHVTIYNTCITVTASVKLDIGDHAGVVMYNAIPMISRSHRLLSDLTLNSERITHTVNANIDYMQIHKFCA